MKKKYILKFYLIISFIYTSSSYGQPTVTVGQPSIDFSFLCQNQDFQNSTISVNVKPIDNILPINKDNFILEISNNNFIDIVNIPIISVSATGNDVTLTFKLPDETYGTNYKFKVKTKSPIAESPATKAFPLYYLIHNTLFTINKNQDNVTVCSGGNYTISIDETDYNGVKSPLFYPKLTYSWYSINGVNETLIPNQKGKSLVVNQSGVYRVKTDYGVCTGSTNSVCLKDVTVTISPTSASATISNSGSDDLCDGNPRTLTANVNNSSFIFKWFKDGTEITGQTSNAITVKDPGLYKLSVDNGVCQFDTNTITLVPGAGAIEATVSPDPATSPISITPGQEIPITLTITQAINPIIEWTFNGQPLNVNANTFIAKKTGKYIIKITQSGGACSAPFERTIVLSGPDSDANVIPNLVTANNDGANDTWKVPAEYSSDNIRVQILNSLGKIVFEGKNYQGTWPENNFDVPNSDPVFYYIIYENDKSIKQGSITVLK